MSNTARRSRRVPVKAARVLLAVSACVFAFGSAMHAIAFATKAAPEIERAAVPQFFGAELKGLWLTDSTTLLAVGVLCAVIAARPMIASRPVVMLLALLPASTAVVLYVFLGGLCAAQLLMAASAAPLL